MQNDTLSRIEAGPESQQLGRYRLLMSLGQGGMGAIHLAVSTGTGDFQKLVVIKELRRDLARNSRFVQLFMHEAKLAGRLNHVNVVQTLEATQAGDRYFMAMEFLEGQPFASLMRVPTAEAQLLRLNVICESLAGLHYAHELRDYGGASLHVVHCDICPHNIFVTYDGHVKVVDFGIAKAAGAERDDSVFQGRLAYAAPEQVRGDVLDRRADVFSVGVLLWEAIAQRRLVNQPNDEQAVVTARLTGTEPRISDVVPGVDPELAAICDKALQLEAEARFATAEEFRIALANYTAKLGPRLDPAAIGRFMSAKFSEERAARNFSIHAALKNEPSVTQRRPLQLVGESEATAIADLSELIERTRTLQNALNIEPDLQQLRPKRRAWWLVAAVGAAAAAGGALSLVGSDGVEPAKAVAAKTAQSEAVGSGAPAAAPTVEKPASAAPEQTGAPASASADVEEEAARPKRRAARQYRKRWSRAGSNAAATPPAQVQRSQPPASRPAEGEPLPTPRRNRKRAIDVDNPFQ